MRIKEQGKGKTSSKNVQNRVSSIKEGTKN